MKVIALTAGDGTLASTQYRLGQFVDSLRDSGVDLRLVEAAGFRDFGSLAEFDLVIIQKRLSNACWVRRVRKGARKLIYDTDDAIWEPHGRRHAWLTRMRTDFRLKSAVRSADACTVANEQLAQYLRPMARQVEMIPMALDEAHWIPESARQPGPLRIGWAGAPPNLAYLSRLGTVLHEVQTLRPETELVVYCGTAPVWPRALRMVHHPYQGGTECGVVRSFDIGLLPLPDDAFAAGKSPIKALQYAACGIPCIASPVGATTSIVLDGETGITARTDDAWREALLRLIDDAGLRRSLGAAARERFLNVHSLASVQGRMIECWKKLIAALP
jgi:hypothetical protein